MDEKDMNIKSLSFEKNDNIAQLEKFKREFDSIVEMVDLMAKLKFAQYKALVDAGFTQQQALTLVAEQKT